MLLKLGLKNMRINYLIISLLFLIACSSGEHLNRYDHSFGVKPTRVIWLQVPGLSLEHLSVLKFYSSDLRDKTEFEKFHCLGKMWNYHTSDLRPNTDKSLMSQLTGQLSIEGNCNDYQLTPVWKIEDKIRYKVGFFSDQNLASSCQKEANDFFGSATRWYMGKKGSVKGDFFNADETSSFNDGEVYFDRSCQGDKCYRDFDDNIKNTFSRFISGKNFYFYIAQIRELETLIKNKRVDKIHDFLVKLEGLITYLKSKTSQRSDATILLSSANVKGIEFPRQGRNWKNELSSRKDVYYRRAQTQSPVLAYGARAESFCGMFHQSELPLRLLTSPE